MFGYGREELLGQTVELLVPERFRDRHLDDRSTYHARPAIRSMGTRADLYGLRKDKSEFPAEISLSPIAADEGMLVYAAIRDVTERKRAEEKIRDNEAQLLAAQKIQAHFFPDRPPSLPGFDVAGAYCPAEFASGDMFDYLPLCDGAMGLVIADVTGHGFAPALLMSSLHAYLRLLTQTKSDVGEILTIANGIIGNEIEDDRFITLLFCRLDPRTRSFEYCNAGHPTGYLLDATGNTKLCLVSTFLPLGIQHDIKFSTVGAAGA